MTYQAIGYHGTYRASADRIQNDGIDLSASSRSSYLGPGLYFWDNSQERAWRWLSRRQERPPADQPVVLQATIDISDFLDLTSEEGRRDFTQFIQAFDARNRPVGPDVTRNDAFYLAAFLALS